MRSAREISHGYSVNRCGWRNFTKRQKPDQKNISLFQLVIPEPAPADQALQHPQDRGADLPVFWLRPWQAGSRQTSRPRGLSLHAHGRNEKCCLLSLMLIKRLGSLHNVCHAPRGAHEGTDATGIAGMPWTETGRLRPERGFSAIDCRLGVFLLLPGKSNSSRSPA